MGLLSAMRCSHHHRQSRCCACATPHVRAGQARLSAATAAPGGTQWWGARNPPATCSVLGCSGCEHALLHRGSAQRELISWYVPAAYARAILIALLSVCAGLRSANTASHFSVQAINLPSGPLSCRLPLHCATPSSTPMLGAEHCCVSVCSSFLL